MVPIQEIQMNPVLQFLATRRSHPPKMMTGPAPDQAQLTQLLTLAARVPDHGKLEPWRFVVLGRQTLDTLAPKLHAAVLADGQDQATADKAASAFASPVVVAVIHSPVDSPKVPEWEQMLSSGAVCLGLVNAALASGWGAAWLTGFAALNRTFGQNYLGVAAHERVAGLIHIGTRGATPPERPRPDITAKAQFLP
ncbi:nitroreductase [Paracoccus sp. JM45]|uniref:nitroreductase family protein n=1 Tax=Paracoccus sp. JM45 TaxID=2283626 RepID=UPI002106E523|nr:nitroreductase [Paracoccus sp. JM45]